MTDPLGAVGAVGVAGDPAVVPTAVTPGRIAALAGSAFLVLAGAPLYLLVDTAVVDHLGVVALSGLGIAAALFSLLLVAGDFVEYGTTGRSARWFGAGRTDRAVDEGVQASWLAVGIGTVLVAVGEVFAGPATRLLAGGAGPTADAATSWLRIGLVGLRSAAGDGRKGRLRAAWTQLAGDHRRLRAPPTE